MSVIWLELAMTQAGPPEGCSLRFGGAVENSGFEPFRSTPTSERTCEQISDLFDMPPREVTKGCVLGNLNDPNSLIT